MSIDRLATIGALLALAGVAQAANPARHQTVSPRVRSVVRADSRTGKLVRTVVVAPRVIAPVVVNESAPSVRPAPAGASIPEVVEHTARKYDVDPLLVHSVIQVESNYNQYALSPKGAQGLMQLMPGTARRFGVSNAWDLRDNIEGGVRYLKYLSTLFPNDLRLTIAAYNAGEGAVWKYNNQIPPYRETEQYVYKVGKRYGEALRNRKPSPPETPKPAETASVVRTEPAEPSYAPIQAFVDAEGRLHMRTIGVAETP